MVEISAKGNFQIFTGLHESSRRRRKVAGIANFHWSLGSFTGHVNFRLARMWCIALELSEFTVENVDSYIGNTKSRFTDGLKFFQDQLSSPVILAHSSKSLGAPYCALELNIETVVHSESRVH